VIVTKINGGLGNQIFQYAIAKSISIKNNIIFKLDITAYETYKLHNGYRLNLFNIDEHIATEEEIKSFKGKDNIINKIINKLNLNKLIYKEKERTLYDKNIFTKKDIYLDGYWQNEKYFINIRDEIIRDFIPKNNNSIIVENYLKDINTTNSVSIHVRRGDYANHPNIGILDISYYQKAVIYMTKYIENPIFYIFSNDIEWCKENFIFIDKKIIIDKTNNEIEDMILMKNCNHNIIANSSFSWWGAWLNKNDNKIVIAPKKWMAENPNNYKWVPDNWVEI
jgi:hypothetical protein